MCLAQPHRLSLTPGAFPLTLRSEHNACSRRGKGRARQLWRCREQLQGFTHVFIRGCGNWLPDWATCVCTTTAQYVRRTWALILLHIRGSGCNALSLRSSSNGSHSQTRQAQKTIFFLVNADGADGPHILLAKACAVACKA